MQASKVKEDFVESCCRFCSLRAGLFHAKTHCTYLMSPHGPVEYCVGLQTLFSGSGVAVFAGT